MEASDPSIAETLNLLGQITRARGSVDTAEAYYKRALEIRERSLGTISVAQTLNGLAILERGRGNYIKSTTYAL